MHFLIQKQNIQWHSIPICSLCDINKKNFYFKHQPELNLMARTLTATIFNHTWGKYLSISISDMILLINTQVLEETFKILSKVYVICDSNLGNGWYYIYN